jgi:subtilisin family serine protease
VDAGLSLWERAGNRGEESRIALLDTGIDLSHPRFAGANIVCGDLVSPGGTGRDIDGHGTACASLILSLAPHCTLLSGRILDRGGSFTYDCLISGLYWAGARKADIICICSGARQPDALAESKIMDLAAGGCAVVAAVGNHGRQGQGAGVYPARSPACFAVGTANDAGEVSFFSNLPKDKDVFCVKGEEFSAATLNGSHQPMTGTSASAAFLAGVLGLVASRRRSNGETWEMVLGKACSKRTSPRGDYLLFDPSGLFSQAV